MLHDKPLYLPDWTRNTAKAAAGAPTADPAVVHPGRLGDPVGVGHAQPMGEVSQRARHAACHVDAPGNAPRGSCHTAPVPMQGTPPNQRETHSVLQTQVWASAASKPWAVLGSSCKVSKSNTASRSGSVTYPCIVDLEQTTSWSGHGPLPCAQCGLSPLGPASSSAGPECPTWAVA